MPLYCVKMLPCKFSIVIILMIVFFNASFSQSKQNNIIARNTLYADFASKGAYYSVNYDRVFHQGKKVSASYRAGFSIFNNVIAAPLGINFFTGQSSSHLEFSLTVVPYIEAYNSFLKSNDLSDKKLYIIPGIGYRYQKAAGGFFL